MLPAELTTQDQTIVGLRAGDKAQLLAELARRAAAVLGAEARTILDALQSRERLGSTGLGRGFALPHARIRGLPRSFGLFARLARPIDFDAIDGAPVDLVFLLLGPDDSPRAHLAALAAISRPLRDAGFMQALRRARDGAALYAALGSPPSAQM